MLNFSKYHGLGNDFILVDIRDLPHPVTPEGVRALCHRHTGIGADGLLIRDDSKQAEHRMTLWNADGSPAEISGNGLRCLVQFLKDRGMLLHRETTVETGGGVLRAELLQDGQIETTMPVPQQMKAAFAKGEQPQLFEMRSLDLSFQVLPVNVGNPHGVIFGEHRDLKFATRYGPPLEVNEHFPHKANIQFAHRVSPAQVDLVTWERGAGLTLACGSGSVATVCAGVWAGHFSFDIPVAVVQAGGTLTITVGHDFAEIRQRGPAVLVFEGTLSF